MIFSGKKSFRKTVEQSLKNWNRAISQGMVVALSYHSTADEVFYDKNFSRMSTDAE